MFKPAVLLLFHELHEIGFTKRKERLANSFIIIGFYLSGLYSYFR